MKEAFPFAAIVGQDEMKMALLIAAVDPAIGGVMVFGDRGTGKSTAVRALAALLPPMDIVKSCRFNCDPKSSRQACANVCSHRNKNGSAESERVSIPVVDLPLGATEDRIVGALDLELALTAGKKAFEPGLLARAHRGFLYIDEVNLLEDHLVDLLLDVAASGENIVERESLSVRHAARFVLIGSGNPEEGELRPQLLDRFGLSVEVKTPADLALRVLVLKRREAFDRDPPAFVAKWKRQNAAVRLKIAKAKENLNAVEVGDALLELMSRLCIAVGADGLRGELTLMRAARAAATLEGAQTVDIKHIRAVAAMALRHRFRRNPLDQSGTDTRVERAMTEVFGAA